MTKDEAFLLVLRFGVAYCNLGHEKQAIIDNHPDYPGSEKKALEYYDQVVKYRDKIIEAMVKT